VPKGFQVFQSIVKDDLMKDLLSWFGRLGLRVHLKALLSRMLEFSREASNAEFMSRVELYGFLGVLLRVLMSIGRRRRSRI
jgi:hypothetical protein